MEAMTDDHATEAQKKKEEEAQKRLQEALLRKQSKPPVHDPHQHGGKQMAPHFSPKPQRRGPRGG